MTTYRLTSLAGLVLALAGSPALEAQASSSVPATRTLLNLDSRGVALAGYDPVAYFTDQKAVKGDPRFHSRYLGATYYFASGEHQTLFESDAPRYAPQFGGYCGYGASQGHPAPIDPEAFVIMHGRLILQNSKSVLERWRKDPEAYLLKADANWPSIVAQYGKP